MSVKNYCLLSILTLFAFTCVMSVVKARPPVPGDTGTNKFLTRRGDKLFLNGKEYRAIGVNIPNLHASHMGFWHHNGEIYKTDANARQAMIDAVLDAEKSGFRFIRFFAGPGYPSDMDKLYMKDREQYWKSMDEVFDLCRKHNLRLVPCLGVGSAAGGFHNYYEEPRRAVMNPKSKTYKAIYEYMREFVTRYKDDPVILMWEIQNEGMLEADVVNKWKEEGMFESHVVKLWEKKAPAADGNIKSKKPSPTVRDDSMSFDMIVRLYKEHAAFIKSIDKNHLVTSGDAGVRPECTSRRETFPNFKFREDSPREHIANNLLSQPEPLDVFSYHVYGRLKSPDETNNGTIEDTRRLCRASMAAGAPVFIGEFASDAAKQDPTQLWTQKFIDMAEKEGISLMTIWVWHFPWQPDLTMDSRKNPDLVRRCAEFNRKYAADGDLSPQK